MPYAMPSAMPEPPLLIDATVITLLRYAVFRLLLSPRTCHTLIIYIHIAAAAMLIFL